MQAVIEPNDPTLSQAMEALSEMDSAAPSQPSDETANVEQQTAGAADPSKASQENAQSETTDDTRLATDPKPPELEQPAGPKAGEKARDEKGKFTKAEKPGEKPAEPAKSDFAKNQERRDKSWKALNEEKDTHRKLVEAENLRLERRKQELDEREARLREQAQPKHKPEDYENHAVKLENSALRLREEARKLEDQGRTEEANAKFKQADRMEYDSEKAKEYAKQLRDNPPPTDAQLLEKFKAEEKKWYTKAGTEFPNAAKEGTPERTALQALVQQVPSLLKNPEQMYYACRLVTAETAANRVPTLEQELGSLRAKVKELEQQLTIPTEDTPGKGGGDINTGPKSFDEGFAELSKDAVAIGAFN